MEEKTSRRSRSRELARVAAVVVAVAAAGSAGATPPDYKSFGRVQRIGHQPMDADLLRIWIVYVGQGDGIVIQLPPKMREGGERAVVLVDAGAHRHVQRFLERLYPATGDEVWSVPLAGAVLTHHDADHAGGFGFVLGLEGLGGGPLYHNGLASWAAPTGVDPACPDGMRAVTQSRDDGDWFMGCFDHETGLLRPDDLVEDVARFSAALEEGRLAGVYRGLAEGLAAPREFPRAVAGGSFLPLEAPASAAEPTPSFELIWPLDPPRRFAGWSETINGNSVTFALNYGEFRMLFTGDHNELSQQVLLDHYEGRWEEVLACDVLKVPHHGSRHGLEGFFRAVHPVVGVASMGGRGFTPGWGHPAREVIRWLGGFHRVYHTHIHESPFEWDELRESKAREEMVERRHLLIETDGSVFRIVEVKLDDDLQRPPSVAQTLRGDGTRWISATPPSD